MEHKFFLESLIWAASLGIFSQVVSERLKQPSIFFLLLSGILFGPQMLNILHPNHFLKGLPVLVEGAVVIILFEGALTLQIKQFKSLSGLIRSILIWGGIITFVLASLAAHFLMNAGWGISFIFGSLMMVTGPTVIGPILKRVKLKKEVSTLLLWESILLDPIGAIIAVVVLDYILKPAHASFSPVFSFPLSITTGVFIGWAFALGMIKILKIRRIASLDNRKNMVLASALLCFGISEVSFANSGLVAVVTMGLVMGNAKIPQFKSILEFKSTITTFLLSTVFVLLAANLNLLTVKNLGPGVIPLVVVIILVVRPLNIFITTWNSGLLFNEKIFLSWLAPRGIVAASIASLFTLTLKNRAYPQAEMLEGLTYLVILTTVVLQGLSAGWVARLLKVREKKKKGFLIIGANAFAQTVALQMKQKGIEVCLVDTDGYDVYMAQHKSLNAYKGSILDESFLNSVNLLETGNLLALTSNDEMNVLSCQIGMDLFGTENCFRIKEAPETSKFLEDSGGQQIFGELPSLKMVLKGLAEKNYSLDVLTLKNALLAEQESIQQDDKKYWPLFVETANEVIPIKVGDTLRAGEKIWALAEAVDLQKK